MSSKDLQAKKILLKKKDAGSFEMLKQSHEGLQNRSLSSAQISPMTLSTQSLKSTERVRQSSLTSVSSFSKSVTSLSSPDLLAPKINSFSKLFGKKRPSAEKEYIPNRPELPPIPKPKLQARGALAIEECDVDSDETKKSMSMTLAEIFNAGPEAFAEPRKKGKKQTDYFDQDEDENDMVIELKHIRRAASSHSIDHVSVASSTSTTCSTVTVYRPFAPWQPSN
jgi:hypothetical protein